MPRTLADMTPAERDACRGMWCEFSDFDDSDGYEYSTGSSRPKLGILVGEIGTSGECEVLTLTHGVTQFCIPEWEITPRFDLPRALSADGEPVKGKWKEGSGTDGDVHIGSYFGHTGTTHRRFVTDWEAKP